MARSGDYPAPDMRRFRAWVVGVFVLLAAGFVNIAWNDGFGHGMGLDTFNGGMADPWQAFINLDLVAGLLLPVGWIIWRELGSPVLQTVAWILLILWWGNIAVALYLLIAISRSKGDARIFFLGNRGGLAPLDLSRTMRLSLSLAAVAVAAVLANALLSVGFAGVPAIGYASALGTVVLLLAAFAAAPDRTIEA